MKIQHSIPISAPKARVWDLTIDVESWPGLSPTFTAIELLGEAPVSVGSTARVKQPGQRARVWAVTAVEPYERFTWTARSMGTTMTASHDLDAADDGGAGGTVNTLTVEIEGRLAPIVGALLRRPILRAITAENTGFKAAAESHR